MMDDARILLRMARGMPRAGSHAVRLQDFYSAQAEHYDRFRERLLRGRAELVSALAINPGEHVVELGGGTGNNLAHLRSTLDGLARLDLVDLCPALLDKARQRWGGRANVRLVEADASTWRPEVPVDVVYLSYALTMIPEWSRTLDNAMAMLKPGGRLGVVDFTLPPPQAALTRRFWRAWFGHDGVHPDDRHVDRLCALLPDHALRRESTRLPYLPGPRAWYYIFVGRKPSCPK